MDRKEAREIALQHLYGEFLRIQRINNGDFVDNFKFGDDWYLWCTDEKIEAKIKEVIALDER